MDIKLVRGIDSQLVDALLLPLSATHLSDVENRWQDRLRASKAEDALWDWRRKERLYGQDAGVETYAIECSGVTQGLIMFDALGHRSAFEPGRRIIYVDYLATAPWNRSSIQNPPEYRTVGRTLLVFARYRSEELGYDGLVGLHSLPSAEPFYERNGMIDCGIDASNEMRYFEWYRRRSDV